MCTHACKGLYNRSCYWSTLQYTNKNNRFLGLVYCVHKRAIIYELVRVQIPSPWQIQEVTLLSAYIWCTVCLRSILLLSLIAILTEWAVVEAPPTIHGTEGDVDAGIWHKLHCTVVRAQSEVDHSYRQGSVCVCLCGGGVRVRCVYVWGGEVCVCVCVCCVGVITVIHRVATVC